MGLKDTDDLEEGYEPIERGVDEYVWIHATGTLVRDAAKTMLEQGLVLSADVFDVFPMYLKKGKAKLGSNHDSVILLVEQERLDEVMSTLRSICEYGLRAYALPVLATEFIQPLSMKEMLLKGLKGTKKQ